MDREEAQRLLTEKLAEYRRRSYSELVSRIGHDEYLQVIGRSDIQYQIEIQFMWDDKQHHNVRVAAGIDDGSLRGAFRPVCADFVITPDGRFVGE